MNELKELIKALRPVQTKFKLIRVGGANDGGYLIPDDLDGIAACFSPGVADTASFEVGLCCRGIGSHLADGSVDGAPKGITPLSFTKKYLDGYNDETNISLFSWVLGTDAYQFGEDLILGVPNGTVIYDTQGVLLADLVGIGTTFIAAQGGHGGLGNLALSSSKRRAPWRSPSR